MWSKKEQELAYRDRVLDDETSTAKILSSVCTFTAPSNWHRDPLPCHPGKDQNIRGHIELDQNVCVI